MQYTSNLNLRKPESNDDVDVSDLNANMDIIDQKVGAQVVRTATVVVAASDASAKSKAQADYVCDGTDDQVEIQAAIDSLPSSGGKVVLMEGEYNLASAVNGKSRLEIVGHRAVIKLGDRVPGFSFDDFISHEYNPWMFLDDDATNWSVVSGAATLSNDTSVYKQGSASLQVAVSSSPSEVKRSFSQKNWDEYGVLAVWVYSPSYSADQVEVKIFEGSNYYKWTFQVRPGWSELFCRLHVPDEKSGTVDLTKVDALSFTLTGAYQWRLDWIRVMPSDIHIEGLEFRGEPDEVPETAIRFGRVAFSTIERCRGFNLGDEFIELHGCRSIMVQDCFAQDHYHYTTADVGPTIDGDPNDPDNIWDNRFVVITKNTIINARSAAIAINGDSNTIAHNKILGSSSDLTGTRNGIDVGGEANIVLDNIIENVGRGIPVGGSGNHIIQANKVKAVGYNEKAIDINSPDNKVLDNILDLTNKTGYGVRLYTNANRTKIRGNLINNFSDGIYFATSFDDVVIEDNDIKGCTTGITVASGSNRTKIRKNFFSGNTTNISDAGSETKIKDNQGYITENSGTATITTGDTSVDVTHGLAATPNRVYLTPTTDTAGKRYWVSAKGTTTFTITIDSTHTADISFDWKAEV